jgi:hypothetical protein
MPIAITIVLIVASVVLVGEFSLTAAAGLALYRPGIERFAHQIQRGQRGGELAAYSLFLVSALIVFVLQAFRSA